MAKNEGSETAGVRTVATPFGQLKVGDTIVCPVSGLEEQVTSVNHRYGKVRTFVRTSRHDHIRPKAMAVERVVR